MKKISLLIIMFLFLIGCNKAVVTTSVMPTEDKKTPVTKVEPIKRPVYYMEGDTSTYVVAFSNKKEYKDFRKKFDDIYKDYAFDTLKTDTVSSYFELILTGKAEIIEKDSVVDSADTLIVEEVVDSIPKRFGKIKVYTAEGFTDEIYNLLASTSSTYKITAIVVDTNAANDSLKDDDGSVVSMDTIVDANILKVKQLTSRLYTVFLDSTFKNSDGVVVSAFDLANSWNSLLKNKPATARALFRNVKGAKEVVKGTEAIAQGLKIRDKFQIDIQMSAPDTLFVKQISSTRALSSLSNTGTYAVTSDDKVVVGLKYNNYSKAGFALADEYTLFQKVDKNPIISFSQKKYDVVPFFQKKDMQYAQKLTKNGATIEELEEQVCFLVLGSNSESNRKYLKKMIDPSRILTTAVMGEGEVYKKDVSEEEDFFDSEIVRIIYRSDIPVQVKTAEKIFADLKQAGLKSELAPVDSKGYEKELVARKFDVAVCTELKRVMNDTNEEIYISGKYFGSIKPLDVLISESKLYPLFSLKRWALCAENVKVFEKRVDGIYRINPEEQQVSIPPAE